VECGEKARLSLSPAPHVTSDFCVQSPTRLRIRTGGDVVLAPRSHVRTPLLYPAQGERAKMQTSWHSSYNLTTRGQTRWRRWATRSLSTRTRAPAHQAVGAGAVIRMPAAAAGGQEMARGRRGAQLFGQPIPSSSSSQSITIAVQLFGQSSTRNLHRACTNLDTGSRAQSLIRESSRHQRRGHR
jgi:hypothetical protein